MKPLALAAVLLGLVAPAHAQQVQNVVASTGTYEDKIELTWTAPADDSNVWEYHIGRGGTQAEALNDTLAIVAVAGGPNYTFTDTWGARAVYCVMPLRTDRTRAGGGCATGFATVRAPEGVVATDYTLKDRVEITWEDRSDAEDAYLITRSGDVLKWLPANATSFVDSTARPGGDQYCVAAHNRDLGIGSLSVCDEGSLGGIDAPQDVQATDGTRPNDVLITWRDVSKTESGFIIYRDGDRLALVEPNVKEYEDTTAQERVEYTYCVATTQSNSPGEPSGSTCDVGRRNDLARPVQLVIDGTTHDDKITLDWVDVEPQEDGFAIVRSKDGGAGDTLAITNPNATGFSDPTAEPGHTYRYCVSAVTRWEASSEAACVEGQRVYVVAPSKVAASDSTAEDQVAISWQNRSTTAQFFRLYRDGMPFTTTPIGTLSAVDTLIGTDVRHEYCVTAVTIYSTGNMAAASLGEDVPLVPRSVVDAQLPRLSSRARFDEQAVLAALGVSGGTLRESTQACDQGSRKLAPASRVAADDDVQDGFTTVTWEDNAKIEAGYRVYATAEGTSDRTLLAHLKPNRTEYVHRTGQAGVAYRYEVVAYDAAMPGCSAAASAPTMPEGCESRASGDQGRRSLAMPTDVRASDGADEIYIDIEWTDNSTAETGYRILRDDAPIATVAANATTYRFGAGIIGYLQPSRYTVQAFDGYSDTASGQGFSLPASDSGFVALNAPRAFNASDTYTDRIALAWSDESNIETEYRVFRDNSLLATLDANATAYETSETGTFMFCVEAGGANGKTSERLCDRGTTELEATEDHPHVSELPIPREFLNGNHNIQSIDIDGDVAVVGMPWAETNKGVAVVYRRDPELAVWHVERILRGSDAGGCGVAVEIGYRGFNHENTQDFGGCYNFGWSVAVSGDKIAVSETGSFYNRAYFHSPVFSHNYYNIDYRTISTVYLFSSEGGTWSFEDSKQEEVYVEREDFREGNFEQSLRYGWGERVWYGFEIKMEGDLLVVGAPAVRSGRNGAAYLFSGVSNNDLELVSTLTGQANSTGEPSRSFGAAVALSDQRYAAGGGKMAQVRGTNASAAVESVPVPTGASFAFPTSLALSQADELYVGDPFARNSSGVLHAYTRESDGWKLSTSAGDPEVGGANLFGFNVAASKEGRLAVSARGRLYEFEVIDGVPTYVAPLLSDRARTRKPTALHFDGLQVGVAYGTPAAYVYEVPISPVGDVTASDGTSADVIEIKWTEGGVADEYQVLRDGKVIQTIASNRTTYVDREATAGGIHEYCVVATSGELASVGVCDGGWRPPNGTISGTITSAQGDPVSGVTVELDPPPAHSLLFDGSGGQVHIDKVHQWPEEFTFELWARLPDLNHESTLFVYRAGTEEMSLHQSGRIMSFTGTGGYLSVSIPANGWHHWAVSCDADLCRVYLDGVEATSGGVQPRFSVAGDLFFGEPAQESNYMKGEIDEARIWSRARSAAEVRADRARPLQGDEADLFAYYPISHGDGPVLLDAVPHVREAAHHGRLQGGVYWADEGAPLAVTVTTNEDGAYTIDNLRYGEGTTFRVRPLREGHIFQPATKNVAVTQESPVQNEVGFFDTSVFDVEGHVTATFTPTQAQTGNATTSTSVCPIPGVELIVDGQPKGHSRGDGSFGFALDPGPHVLVARRAAQAGDHQIAEARRAFELRENLTGLHFDDQTKRSVELYAGGSCGHALGTVTLHLTTADGCFDQTLVTDATGHIRADLPPLDYRVEVVGVDLPAGSALDEAAVLTFFEHLGTVELDLTDGSTDSTGTAPGEVRHLDLIYRAPLSITVEGLPSGGSCSSSVTLASGAQLPGDALQLSQNDLLPLTIHVVEDYGGGFTCPVDSALVTITDEISDRDGEPVVLQVSDGTAEYEMAVGKPFPFEGRRVDGRNRSYQKAATFFAEVPGRSQSHTEWAIVTGVRPRTGTFFTAPTSPMPMFVLHDPPGDNSHSFLEEGSKLCASFEGSVEAGVEAEAEIDASTKISILTAPLGIGAATEIEGGIKFVVEAKASATLGLGANVCVSTMERFSTSDSPINVGAGADLFIGYGLNYLFAEADRVALVPGGAGCTLRNDLVLAAGPDPDNPINTVHQYTRSHIEGTLLPQIDTLIGIEERAAAPDQAVIHMLETSRQTWHDMIEVDRIAQQEMAQLIENRSFNAGAGYETNATLTGSAQQSVAGQVELALGANFEGKVGGLGVEAKAKVTLKAELKGSLDEEASFQVGYALADDDAGDYFTVDVLRRDIVGPVDDAMQTLTQLINQVPGIALPTFVPVDPYMFRLVSGTSSNPHEPGTAARDRALAQVNPPRQDGVAEDGRAAFTLSLTHAGDTHENREYQLRVLSASNPGGADIRIAGSDGNRPKSFWLENSETQEVTVTVGRGPTRYRYDDLQIIAYPPGEYALWEDNGLNNNGIVQQSDTVSLSVHFDAVCSDIAFNPTRTQAHDFVYRAGVGNLEVLLQGFHMEASEADSVLSIGSEYRLVGSNDWVSAYEVQRDALRRGNGAWASSHSQPWSGPARDGQYELRAFTRCHGGHQYSTPVTSTVDRQAPQVFGSPQPAGGVLTVGNDVQLTFAELMRCGDVNTEPRDGTSDTVVLRFADEQPTSDLPDKGEALATRVVCNGASLVIEPSMSGGWDNRSLENRRIEAVVGGLHDRIGNAMIDSTRWQFRVRRAAFGWSTPLAAHHVAQGSAQPVVTHLANGSAEPAQFTMPSTVTLAHMSAGVPTGAQLTAGVSPSSGTLPAGQVQSIAFSMPPSAPLGVYEGSVRAYRSSAGGMTDSSDVQLSVTVGCAAPDVAVDPADYLHSMSLTGHLFFGDVRSSDPLDRLVAYHGQEPRGMAAVDAAGMVRMTIYGMGVANERLRFAAFDASECRFYDQVASSASMVFEADAVRGSNANPVQLRASGDASAVSVPLSEGWTLFSINRTPTYGSVSGVLGSIAAQPGDVVKSQTQFAQYSPVLGWQGSLQQIVPGEAYMIRVGAPSTLIVPGPPVDLASTPIALEQGWNWIGYSPQAAQPVGDALASLADASEGDVIKSQTQFAQFSGSGWLGSLRTMEPGKGYKIQLGAAGTLTYTEPSSSSVATLPSVALSASEEQDTRLATPPAEWFATEGRFSRTMTLVAEPRSHARAEGLVVAAFVQTDSTSEPRGMAPVQMIDGSPRAFVVVQGEREGEVLTLRFFDTQSGETMEAVEALRFEADAVEGTPNDPVVFRTQAVAEAEAAARLPDVFSLDGNFPNPAGDATTLRYALPEAVHVEIVVYDMLGRVIARPVDERQEAGHRALVFDSRSLASGVYVYRLRAGDFEASRQLTVVH